MYIEWNHIHSLLEFYKAVWYFILRYTNLIHFLVESWKSGFFSRWLLGPINRPRNSIFNWALKVNLQRKQIFWLFKNLSFLPVSSVTRKKSDLIWFLSLISMSLMGLISISAMPIQAFFKALFYNQYRVVKTQSWIELWCLQVLILLLFFFKPWKIFHSIHLFFLLFLWFRYLQIHIKESCMYLSSQLFCKTRHKTLKIPRKIRNCQRRSEEKSERVSEMHFPVILRPKFQNFPFGAHHGG